MVVVHALGCIFNSHESVCIVSCLYQTQGEIINYVSRGYQNILINNRNVMVVNLPVFLEHQQF